MEHNQRQSVIIFGDKTQAAWCTHCFLTKKEAIEKHLDICKDCTFENCPFREEIKLAIESKTPEIKWIVDKNEIFENEQALLSWEVSYASKVCIMGIGEVQPNGNQTIFPRKNACYTISVQDYRGNTIERSVFVKVFPLPSIQIKEEIIKIETGKIATFHWQVNNVNSLILSFDNQTIDVSGSTDFSVQPDRETVYRLIATALDNKTTIENSVTIEVFPRPEIVFFNVTPGAIIGSMPVTLSWEVVNAKRIVINNGIGEVSEKETKTLLLDKSVLYQLTAYGELSSVSQYIGLAVFPTPIIESLLVPLPDFENSVCLAVHVGVPKIDVSIHMPEIPIDMPEVKTPNLNLGTPELRISPPKFNLSPPVVINTPVNIQTHPIFTYRINKLSKIYDYVRNRFRI